MKKSLLPTDIIILALSVTCVSLVVALCFLYPWLLLPSLSVALVIAAVLFWNVYHVRKTLARMLQKGGEGVSARYGLARLNLPVLVISGEHVLWYNTAFRAELLGGQDACLLSVSKLLPGFNRTLACDVQGLNMEHEGRRYTVYGSSDADDEKLFIAYFFDNTVLKRQAGEYLATRPSVLMLTVDTYDEMREMKDSERSRVLGLIDLALEQFIGTTTGLLRRTAASQYMAVVEERHMQEIVKSRFALLDTVREIETDGVTPTLSIGVGRLGETLQECQQMAEQALDMALGRGGDQAAVKSPAGFEFYGGVSRGVEKRNKVRSRIIATAFCDLARQSSNVLIMGHRISDLDSIGAACGMWRMCKICGVPASVVVDERQSLAGRLVQELREDGVEFIRPEAAESAVTGSTLVVIVDTHLEHLLESKAVYHAAKNVVVIDHHRRCVGYIENAVIFHHEPSASSASELVAEMLQYVNSDKDDRLTAKEAQGLLAGIMLDTRSFALHTGVRTFEAAAYLRRMGAQTAQVKQLFNSSLESYSYKAHIVTAAQVYNGCAVAATDALPPEYTVVAPQAANDLLTIDGVEASFVLIATAEGVSISARSMGAFNVQVVMEKLGGGGHLTMAGAQLQNASLDEARAQLLKALDEYREEQHK